MAMLESRPSTAADLMSRNIIAVGPEDEIGNILGSMEKFRFRHLPVVRGDKLVGLVTHRDLLHASSSFLSDKAAERDEVIGHVHVKDIMQTEILTASPKDRLSELGLLLFEAKVGCVCVVDDDEKLVGIITEADFIRCALWFFANS
jgi:CBS domain-containing protein